MNFHKENQMGMEMFIYLFILLSFIFRSGYSQLTGNREKNVKMAITSQLEIARKR